MRWAVLSLVLALPTAAQAQYISMRDRAQIEGVGDRIASLPQTTCAVEMSYIEGLINSLIKQREELRSNPYTQEDPEGAAAIGYLKRVIMSDWMLAGDKMMQHKCYSEAKLYYKSVFDHTSDVTQQSRALEGKHEAEAQINHPG